MSLTQVQIDAALPRGPLQQAEYARGKWCEWSPIMRASKWAPIGMGKPPEGTIFGGELITDEALIRDRGAHVFAMQCDMKLKALMLYFHNACIHGDPKFGFKPIARTGPISVGTKHGCDWRLDSYTDLGSRLLSPAGEKGDWTMQTEPSPFTFHLCDAELIEESPIYGFRLEWIITRE